MRFSIIIPLFNDIIGIERLLYSLNLQTFKSFEVIVVDDGSTINYQDVFLSYPSLQIVYKRIKNTGSPSTPRNIGFSLAKGEYICFLDCDDYYHHDALIKLNSYVKPLNINYFYLEQFVECNGVIEHRGSIIGKYRRFEGKLDDLFEFNYIPTSGVCIKKDILLEFDSEPFNQDVIEDWHLWLSLVKFGLGINRIPEVLGYYKLSLLNGMSTRYTLNHYFRIYLNFKSEVKLISKFINISRIIYIMSKRIYDSIFKRWFR